ncbi:uncharacterized protein [Lepisosteus oculatus]|uniref:uncharacterized protein isoform X2 n=1 Tax=Lepisosteus oculatus TaxID=7918 RepID=UPI0035F50C49
MRHIDRERSLGSGCRVSGQQGLYGTPGAVGVKGLAQGPSGLGFLCQPWDTNWQPSSHSNRFPSASSHFGSCLATINNSTANLLTHIKSSQITKHRGKSIIFSEVIRAKMDGRQTSLTEQQRLQFQQIASLHSQIKQVQARILGEEVNRKLLAQAFREQSCHHKQLEKLESQLQTVQNEVYQLIGEPGLVLYSNFLMTPTQLSTACQSVFSTQKHSSSAWANDQHMVTTTEAEMPADRLSDKGKSDGNSEPSNSITSSTPYISLKDHSDIFCQRMSLSTPSRAEDSPSDESTVSANSFSSSAGLLEVKEVNSAGHFVRLRNTSPDRNTDLGGYMLQQRVGGAPVSLYRIPPHTWVPSGQCITIWAGGAKVSHNPPSDLVWHELLRFRTGSECATVLCKPSGQPVAWLMPPQQVSVSMPFNSETVSARSCHRASTAQGWRPLLASHSVSARRLPEDQQHKHSTSAPPPKRRQKRNLRPVTPLPPSAQPSTSYCGKDVDDLQNWHPGVTALLSRALSGKGGSSQISETSSWRSSAPSSLILEKPVRPRLNRKSPLVALIAQRTARSKYGFKFLSSPPITSDIHVIRR